MSGGGPDRAAPAHGLCGRAPGCRLAASTGRPVWEHHLHAHMHAGVLGVVQVRHRAAAHAAARCPARWDASLPTCNARPLQKFAVVTVTACGQKCPARLHAHMCTAAAARTHQGAAPRERLLICPLSSLPLSVCNPLAFALIQLLQDAPSSISIDSVLAVGMCSVGLRGKTRLLQLPSPGRCAQYPGSVSCEWPDRQASPGISAAATQAAGTGYGAATMPCSPLVCGGVDAAGAASCFDIVGATMTGAVICRQQPHAGVGSAGGGSLPALECVGRT